MASKRKWPARPITPPAPPPIYLIIEPEQEQMFREEYPKAVRGETVQANMVKALDGRLLVGTTRSNLDQLRTLITRNKVDVRTEWPVDFVPDPYPDGPDEGDEQQQ